MSTTPATGTTAEQPGERFARFWGLLRLAREKAKALDVLPKPKGELPSDILELRVLVHERQAVRIAMAISKQADERLGEFIRSQDVDGLRHLLGGEA